MVLRSHTGYKFIKRTFSLMLALLLLLNVVSLWRSDGAQAASDGMIRVKLSRLGSPSSVTFKTSGAYTVNGSRLSDGASATVSASSGVLTLTSGGKTLATGTTISVNRTSGGTSCGVRFTSPSLGNLFCGDVIFTASGGAVQTVLRIYIETYLYGVVPYEMSNSFPIEALKAQAVSARTYAMRAKRSGGSYDVTDSTTSQVFRGYTSSYANAIRAVDETKGVCLMSGGSYAQCYYTASNGGQTESAKNIWGGGASYLTVKDDPYDLENPSSIVKSASIAKDGAAISSALEAKILQAAGLNDARIVSVNAAELHTPRYAAPSRTYTRLRLNVTFSVNGETRVRDVNLGTYGDLETHFGLSINSGSNEIVSLSEKDGAFMLSFRRFGHGVGLSQRGAQWMALNYGKNYSEILEFYYPGTSQQRLSLSESLNAGGSVAPTNTPVPIESEDGYTTLQEGDSGEAVKALQTKLKELGFFTGTPLGNYKSLTVAAVRAYQAKNGLTVDGVASPALQKRIFEETVPGVTSTPTIEPSGETLKYGSTGESVKALQRKLKELGYFSGSIGGNYLAQTEAAVKAFQSAHGLTADGVATPELQRMILSTNAMQTPTATPAPETSGTAATVRLGNASSRLNVRASASTSSAIRGTLKNGQSVTVTGTSGAWSQITAGTISGYVMTQYLSIASQPTPSPEVTPAPTAALAQNSTATVRLGNPSSRLNVRRGPGTNTAVVGTLSHGQSVTVTGTSGAWSQITAGTISGYVMTSYLQGAKADSPETTPAPTTEPTAAPDGETLKYGSTGESVKALQRALQKLGYFTGSIGGNYLNQIEEAVRAYQLGNGLTADGVATPEIQRMILKDASAAASDSTSAPTATPAPETSGTAATVKLGNASSRLNVRASASTSSSIVGTLSHGQSVVITGASGAWSRITAGKISGYVMTQYLRTGSTPAAEPTVQPTAAPETDDETLQYGSTGEAVKAIQRKLKELGYFDGSIGGNYLTKTEAAVRAFQAANGLTADGVATKDVQRRILSAASGGDGCNATVSVGGSYLNMRVSADASSKRLDKLYDGTRITVLGEESGWYKIEYGGQTGYVIKSAVVKD